ncbi:MAG: hypothetical protein Q4P71_08945 [Actinomycetaceae bacterium]|nr:hypothetical protein [Actinomycetaceae bacterium]
MNSLRGLVILGIGVLLAALLGACDSRPPHHRETGPQPGGFEARLSVDGQLEKLSDELEAMDPIESVTTEIISPGIKPREVAIEVALADVNERATEGEFVEKVMNAAAIVDKHTAALDLTQEMRITLRTPSATIEWDTQGGRNPEPTDLSALQMAIAEMVLIQRDLAGEEIKPLDDDSVEPVHASIRFYIDQCEELSFEGQNLTLTNVDRSALFDDVHPHVRCRELSVDTGTVRFAYIPTHRQPEAYIDLTVLKQLLPMLESDLESETVLDLVEVVHYGGEDDWVEIGFHAYETSADVVRSENGLTQLRWEARRVGEVIDRVELWVHNFGGENLKAMYVKESGEFLGADNGRAVPVEELEGREKDDASLLNARQ